MSSQPRSNKCGNSECPFTRKFWLRRLKQPKGLWLNKTWYCSTDCFEQGAEEVFSRFNLRTERGRSARYRLPVGLLLLSKGLITGQHLQEALKAQRESQRGRLGQWLRQQGLVTEEQLTAALGAQWGIPVFHPAQSTGSGEWASMTPLPLMEASRMAPLHFVAATRTLYVAFSDGIDFAALRALEQMLDCSTQACVISESEMVEALEWIRQSPRPSETVMDCPRLPAQLAATTREWAESNKVDQVRTALSSEHLWIRLQSSSLVGHLLFRLSGTDIIA